MPLILERKLLTSEFDIALESVGRLKCDSFFLSFYWDKWNLFAVLPIPSFLDVLSNTII